MPSWRNYVAGKSPIFLLELDQTWSSRQIFIKTLNTIFHGNSCSGSRADTLKTNGWRGGGADGRDDANRRLSRQCEYV